MKKRNKKQNTGPEEASPREVSLRPVAPAGPLSRVQHIISGVVIIVVLLILTVAAISVNNWRRQNEKTSSTSGTSQSETITNETSETELSDSIIYGHPIDVKPVSLARGDEIIVGIDSNIEIINPLYSSSDGEKDLVSLIFEPLIKVGDSSRPLPVLASSWSFDQAAKVLSFSLNTSHYFRDGRAVSADDVVFTYECLLSDSYNGPYKGRFGEIIAVKAGGTPDIVEFQLDPAVTEPDFSLFTVGIMKHDHYNYPLDRVFEMYDDRKSPEGSGAYELDESGENITVNLRAGYAGEVKAIVFVKIDSDEKYDLLLEGKLDIVRNLWNERMIIRAKSLSEYSFYPIDSRIESYVLIGRSSSGEPDDKREQLRQTLLMSVAGCELSAEQKSLLESVEQKITWYYFNGVNDVVSQKNLQMLEQLAESLDEYPIQIEPKGIDWPEMATLTETGNFDLMLLPAPSNNRLPPGSSLLRLQADGTPENSKANIWPASRVDEVIIVSARIQQISISRNAFPLSSSTAGWTERIANIRLYSPSVDIAEGEGETGNE